MCLLSPQEMSLSNTKATSIRDAASIHAQTPTPGMLTAHGRHSVFVQRMSAWISLTKSWLKTSHRPWRQMTPGMETHSKPVWKPFLVWNRTWQPVSTGKRLCTSSLVREAEVAFYPQKGYYYPGRVRKWMRSQAWQHTTLIPVVGGRHGDLCELEASLSYTGQLQDSQEFIEKLCL